jgi:hypothetical protein
MTPADPCTGSAKKAAIFRAQFLDLGAQLRHRQVDHRLRIVAYRAAIGIGAGI